MAGNIDVCSLPSTIFMLEETYSIGMFTALQYIVSYFAILLKIILIDDSDVIGFQGFRVLQSSHTPVDYPII